MDENSSRQKIIDDFLSKPSKYDVEVIDNSMLPPNLKKRPSISFVVKPPTIMTLARISDILMTIPEDVFKKEVIKESEALKYLDQMVKLFCAMSWGKSEDYPSWYEPFLKNNLTGNEMFKLFKEMSIKSQTSFFLTSLKMVEGANPMMMRQFEGEKDSTPTNSSDK